MSDPTPPAVNEDDVELIGWMRIEREKLPFSKRNQLPEGSDQVVLRAKHKPTGQVILAEFTVSKAFFEDKNLDLEPIFRKAAADCMTEWLKNIEQDKQHRNN